MLNAQQVGTILKFAGGSANGVNAQFAILTTNGLYFWGKAGILVDSNVKSGNAFGKANALATQGVAGTNNFSLPMGVAPGDVKMMFGTYNTLAIVTCSGDAWVLSQNRYLYGDGITSNNNSYKYVWHRVSTATNTPLTDVVAMRGSTSALMALTSTGKIYSWGQNVYRGNSLALVSTQTFAIEMFKPSGTVKQIGMTGGNSYYVLNSIGELYSLGNNSNRSLGDFTTTNRTDWVRVLQNNTGTPLPTIAWISPNEHASTSGGSPGYAAMNALTPTGELWSWGENSFEMLGGGGSTINPTSMIGGLSSSDFILAVETGGHTTLAIKKCSLKYGYIGHKTNGSMGDGTTDNTQVSLFNFTDTAEIFLCGAATAPTVKNLKICPGETADLANAHTGSIPVGQTLEWYTTSTRDPGTKVLAPSAVGIGTYYAFYEGSCPSPQSSIGVIVSYYVPGDGVVTNIDGILPTLAGAVASYNDGFGNFAFDATYKIDSGGPAEVDPVSAFGFSADATAVRDGTESITFSATVYSLDMTVDDIDLLEPASLTFYDATNTVIPTATVQAALFYTGSNITISYPATGTIKGTSISNANINGDQTRYRVKFPSNIGIKKIVYTQASPTGSGYNSLLLNSAAAFVPTCACYDLPNNGAGELPTKHGITTLQRAGGAVASNNNWPMVRTGAWTVLESKTKGFVITRMTTLEIEGQVSPLILSKITNPQEGMMVYDTTVNCLKIYSDSVWKCFDTVACP